MTEWWRPREPVTKVSQWTAGGPLQAAGETVSRIGAIRARAGDEHQTIVN